MTTPPPADLWIVAAQAAQVGILAVDSHGRIALANRCAERLFGYRRDEMLGMSVEMLIPDRHRQQHRAHRAGFNAVPQTRQMGHGRELHGRRQDGGEFMAEIGLEFAGTPGDGVTIVTVVDIAERIGLRKALLERDVLHQTLFDAMRDGVGVIQDARFVMSNAALRTLTGHCEQDFAQQPFTDMIAPESAPMVADLYGRLRSQDRESGARSQFRLLRADGVPGPWVEANARRVVFNGRPASLVVMRDITDWIAATEELMALAGSDVLTGLPNRRRFMDRLEQAILSARRHHQVLAVVYIDLDGFKPINDAHGHAAGDHVLREVASRLLAQLRATDTVGRLGGDEFAVVLTDLESADVARMVGGKLFDEIARPIRLGAQSFRVGASGGIALFPDHGADAQQLLARADEAMYAVKASGKNALRLWSANLAESR